MILHFFIFILCSQALAQEPLDLLSHYKKVESKSALDRDGSNISLTGLTLRRQLQQSLNHINEQKLKDLAGDFSKTKSIAINAKIDELKAAQNSVALKVSSLDTEIYKERKVFSKLGDFHKNAARVVGLIEKFNQTYATSTLQLSNGENYSSSEEKLHSLEAKAISLLEAQRSARLALANYDNEIESLTNKANELEAQMVEVTTLSRTMMAHIEARSSTAAHAQDELAALTAKMKDVKGRRDALNAQILALHAKRAPSQQKLDTLSREYQTVSRNRDAAILQLRQAELMDAIHQLLNG